MGIWKQREVAQSRKKSLMKKFGRGNVFPIPKERDAEGGLSLSFKGLGEGVVFVPRVYLVRR